MIPSKTHSCPLVCAYIYLFEPTLAANGGIRSATARTWPLLAWLLTKYSFVSNRWCKCQILLNVSILASYRKDCAMLNSQWSYQMHSKYESKSGRETTRRRDAIRIMEHFLLLQANDACMLFPLSDLKILRRYELWKLIVQETPFRATTAARLTYHSAVMSTQQPI